MKEQFVTYEIALKLKELGFDEECFAGYDDNGILWYPAASRRNSTTKPRSYKKISHQNKHITKTPLWQQVIDWFREEYDIIIVYSAHFISGYLNHYWNVNTKSNDINSEHSYSGYTNTIIESREQAILNAIELCNKQ